MTTARIIITLGAVSPCGSGQLVLGEAMMSNSINESTDTVHRASTMHLGNKYAVAEVGERGREYMTSGGAISLAPSFAYMCVCICICECR